MGITLEQLYEHTRDKFALEVLAGHKAMKNNVTRLYYMEDIYISDWTRRGELIVTTAMSGGQRGWLKRLIDSLLPYGPSGVAINVGGYVRKIPQEIIDYCNKVDMPLLIFPWNIFLQDVMQEWTNLIFRWEQMESDVANAFLNAIYSPENTGEYAGCLEKNGYGGLTPFVAASVRFQSGDNSAEHRDNAFGGLVQGMCDRAVYISCRDRLILIFCGMNKTAVKEFLRAALREWLAVYSKEKPYIGIGTPCPDYSHIGESYEKACVSQKYGERQNKPLCCIDDMGAAALLLTCDRQMLGDYMESRLGRLKRLDRENQSEYLKTLKAFIKNNGNGAEVAKELYVHRNTVNYRIHHIKELLDVSFDTMDDFLEYQLAFTIMDILSM